MESGRVLGPPCLEALALHDGVVELRVRVAQLALVDEQLEPLSPSVGGTTPQHQQHVISNMSLATRH